VPRAVVICCKGENRRSQVMITKRLKKRQTSIISRSYLVYRALWPALERAVKRALEDEYISGRPVVVDIGCGEKPYADWFEATDYIGLNYGTSGALPDIVGDAQCLPIQSEHASIVFSTQVIEHVPNPVLMVREIHRILKPGGLLVLSGPFCWPLHEEPHDYYRFTVYGFRYLLSQAGFEIEDIQGDCGALTQVSVAVIGMLPRTLFFLVPIINMGAILLQRFSKNRSTTLNYVVIARRK